MEIYLWRPEQRWQYESGMNTWIKSVQVPDFFDFDPDMMKVLFRHRASAWTDSELVGRGAIPWAGCVSMDHQCAI
jgi:hypothetical protein